MTTENNTPDTTFDSDYEAEWALNSDTPKLEEKAVDHTEDVNKPTEKETAPSSVAQEETPTPTQNDDSNKAAEPKEEDILAGLSEAQLEAYRKAERDAKAMKGRHRLAQDRIVDLEKKLAEEQKAKAEFKSKARQPTEFEQNHPEYFQELKEEFGTNQESSAPQTDPEAESYSEADAILSAHPDAGDIYSSSEFQTWMASQPLKVQQDVESSYSKDVIPVLDAYQNSLTSASSVSLKEIADVGGSQGQPDLRDKSKMTDAEKYELEWESDD